eukprot:TRINITY_DN8853_c0_g1_i1.p1 TRINITY_DN8853_c0_g1~~TRINITY_DN8853_c0_g1_i1.p1  ORF type:complete len:251 (-),score=48.47 TRINITY_DN8853_c0_g1_i1:191-943(-)
MSALPELFTNQVAGHGDIIVHDGLLFKPAPSTEADFYENVPSVLPDLLPLAPKYFGRQTPPDAKPLKSSQTYIALEDITRGLKQPCILDLKMGTHLTADWAPAQKVLQRAEVARTTTTARLGLRVCGIKISKSAEIVKISPSDGKKLTADGLISNLREFFTNGPNWQDRLRHYQHRLDQIAALVQSQQAYKFYSTSLLFVYDAASADTTGWDLRMIDFAQSQRGGTTDDGYMTGVRTLRQIMSELLPQLP